MRVVFLFFLFSCIVYSSSLEEIAHQKKWLLLLHYDNYSSGSDITSKEFFLAKDGATNPLSELKATLKAYQDSSNIVCRYPARYTWLNRVLHLEDFSTKFSQCKTLQKRLETLDVDSISLVFVSGYMKNPASTFGHTFIKLNSKQFQNNLFDSTISFGAIVPDKENIIAYIFKGIFGFYDASFRDKYFFTHDMTYNYSELRDMWEYQLEIPKKDVELFVLHIFEILNVKMEYYFFKRNCAFESVKLLELVLDKDILPSYTLWYAPIEPFVKLAQTNKLISAIRYYPSRQQQLYKLYTQLQDNQKKLVNQFIQANQNQFHQESLQIIDRQIEVINFLLEYYKYKIAQKDDNEALYKTIKSKLLFLRLVLPQQKVDPLPMTLPKERPDTTSAIIHFDALVGYNSIYEFFPTFGFSFFALDPVTKNTLDGSQLRVLSGEIGYAKKRFFVKNFDFIKIQKYTKKTLPFESLNLSWDIEFAVKNIKENQYDYFGGGSIGKSWFFQNGLFALLMELSLHSLDDDNIQVKPKFVFEYNQQNFKNYLQVGYSFHQQKEANDVSVLFESSYIFNKTFALYGSYKKDQTNWYLFGVRYFFER